MALISKRFASPQQKLHQHILKKVTDYQSNFWKDSALRENMLLIDKYYSRSYGVTQETLKARLAAIRGETFKIANFITPIVLPQVESALGYLSSVYLTGSPIIAAGAPPQYADAALSFNTVIENNSLTAGWARNLMLSFRDGLKYGICGVEVYWDSRRQASITNGGPEARVSSTVWKGNAIEALNMYNVFYDRRVMPTEVYKRGDFAGYSKVITACELREYLNELDRQIHGAMAAAAVNSRWGDRGNNYDSAAYYVPNVNYDLTGTDKSERSGGQQDWSKFFNQGPQQTVGNLSYSDAYLKTVCYIRLIPEVEGITNVAEERAPQVWKCVIINNTIITEFSRTENAHGFIPILLCQPLEDMLGAQSLSFSEHLIDMQDLSSAFWNAVLQSKRRAVNDRAIFNPLLLNESDVNNPNPAAKIPLRSAAYNRELSNAYFPIPYHDEQSGSFVQLADAMYRFSNQITGNNPAKQGQFVKGNKTLHEYEDVMGNSDIRGQMMALLIEHQLFSPMKEIIKLNTLQFQEKTTYVNAEQEREVEVDPVKLRQAAMFFKMSDGMVPMDKLLSTEELTVAFQTMQSISAIGAEYRVGEVFGYLLKGRHVDLRPFKKSATERQYEQQMAAWQQAAQLAAEKGAPFSTPMPTPPSEQQIKQEDEQAQKMTQLPLMQQVLNQLPQQQQQGAQNAQAPAAAPATPPGV